VRAIDPELVWQMLIDHIGGNILFTPLTLWVEGLHAGGTWNSHIHTLPSMHAPIYHCNLLPHYHCNNVFNFAETCDNVYDDEKIHCKRKYIDCVLCFACYCFSRQIVRVRAIDPELVWQMLIDHIGGNILFTPLTLWVEGLHAGGTWKFAHTHPPFNAHPSYQNLNYVFIFYIVVMFVECRVARQDLGTTTTTRLKSCYEHSEMAALTKSYSRVEAVNSFGHFLRQTNPSRMSWYKQSRMVYAHATRSRRRPQKRTKQAKN
jgi:hypothetical protein